MASNEVVKSVAKKLKYYFEVKRLEDGFDLSDVHQPQLDHPPLKVRPALQYSGLHDRALKHYFSQPEVRVQLTQLNGQHARGTLHGRKEVQVRKMLDNYMRHYSFQKNPLPSCYYWHSPKGCYVKPEVTGVLRRKKKAKHLIGGWPVLRSVPEQHVTKGEAARLVNSATKIICASEIANKLNKQQHVHKNEKQPSAPSSFERPRRFDRAPRDDPVTWVSLMSQKETRPTSARLPKRKSSPKRKLDDGYVLEPVRRTPEPRPASSKSTTTTATTSSSASTEELVVSRPRSAKYRSRTVINVQEPRPQEEVAVIRSTQTITDYDVDQPKDRQKIEKFDQLEEEVRDGPLCEYQVYVHTGSCLGASTKAPVKLIMYGEKGRTREFELNKLSKKHKIPFQKGKEDLFILSAHHIGRIRKIQIGHDRPELNYAWHLHMVTVFDMHAKRIFQFPCDRWLSGQDGDRKTYRILHVDREKDFIQALDESMTKSPRTQSSMSESESSSTVRESSQKKSKAQDNYSTRVRPSGNSSESDSDASSRSSTASSDYSDPKHTKVPVRGDVTPSPRGKKKVVKDDYEEKATKITLHTKPDNKQVDEIIVDNRGRDAQVKPAQEFVEGYKAAISASEQEKKRQLERAREMERLILQGKSIHDAVRDGDIDRVKDLLHHFPEMRDFRDESSWTPLHLAAARGNIELLRWLVTSDADINAETATGYNAMHIAAMNGHVNSMMLLQAMGSSIFGLTVEKQSALHLAAKSGHLECVKWLVANRASLIAEDASGRSALKLAEEFHHDPVADFLRVCMRELSNPKSTFAQMHGRRISGSGLPPIEEDANSGSGETPWKDDVDVKGRGDSDSEDENKNKKKSKAEEKELEEKRKVFKEQHDLMADKNLSFLDSIRQEVN